MELRQFIAEMRSRGVYRVAAIYSAGAWALLQVADVLFPIMGLPDWSITAVLASAALGFPISVILSWVFDLTPQGIVETGPASSKPVRHKWTITHIIELALILILTLLVGYLYAERLATRTLALENPGLHPPGGRASIAVMPFVNMGEARQMEYLGDGLAEEILNLLAKLNELDVAARTSSFFFKNKAMDIRDIGSQLGVSHVLEGSVRQDKDRVRVTAQLIDSTNGYHLWSETYDRNLGSVLALQDEIAGQVVDQLQLLLSPESRNALSGSEDIDPAAYDYYLRGRAYLRLPRSTVNFESAMKLFNKALEKDSRFADAYAGLCDSLLGLYSVKLEKSRFHQAESACQSALTLDRRAVSVYLALGNLYRNSGQYHQAINEFNTALSLNPGLPDAYLGLADTYLDDGQDELARLTYQGAIDLQPNYWKAQMGMGNYYFYRGQVEEAIPYYRRITELMPADGSALNNLGAALFLFGDFKQAAYYWEESLAHDPSSITYSNIATSLYFMGRYKEAVPLYQKALEFTPEHYEVWGNLGDTYSQIPRNADLATTMYKNAIKLAKSRLQVNSSDSNTLGLIAHYQARIDERELALVNIEKAMALAPDDMYVQSIAATTLATLGDRERALDALERSLDAGYPWRLARADASLKNLRDMPRYLALSARME